MVILSPQIFCTVSIKGKGTKSPTSPGDVSVTDLAISSARLIASPLVAGFNFQFPVMKAFLSKSSVEEILLKAGLATKADADVASARDEAKDSFMMVRLLEIVTGKKQSTFVGGGFFQAVDDDVRHIRV